jgi:hypothetical protein
LALMSHSSAMQRVCGPMNAAGILLVIRNRFTRRCGLWLGSTGAWKSAPKIAEKIEVQFACQAALLPSRCFSNVWLISRSALFREDARIFTRRRHACTPDVYKSDNRLFLEKAVMGRRWRVKPGPPGCSPPVHNSLPARHLPLIARHRHCVSCNSLSTGI